MSSTAALLAAASQLGPAEPARATPVERNIAQLKHTRWTRADDLPGQIYSLAQTPDGFLWLGMSNGLYRFDGLTFERIATGAAEDAEDGDVYSLLVTRRGDLWMVFGKSGRFAVYRRGQLRYLPSPPPGEFLLGLTEAPDGAIWAANPQARKPMIRHMGTHWESVMPNAGLFDDEWSGTVFTPDGAMWVGYARHVVRRGPGERQFRQVLALPRKAGRIFAGPSGQVWLLDPAGIRRISGDNGRWPATPGPALPGAADFRPPNPLFDRDGNLWLGRRSDGLLRIARRDQHAQSRAATAFDGFTKNEGLTSNPISAILEDRQGSIWVATSSGLDRFSATDFVVEPQLVNPAQYGDKLMAASDGSVYIAEADALYRVPPGGVPTPIASDVREPWSLCEAPDGAIVLVETARVRSFSDHGQRELAPIPRVAEGLYSCAFDRSGTLWQSAGNAGLYRWDGMRWINEAVPPGATGAMISVKNGLVAIQDETGLIRHAGQGWKEWLRAGIAPANRRVLPLMPLRGTIVMGGESELARVDGTLRQQISHVPELQLVNGMAESEGGIVWAFGSAGLVRLSASDLDRAFREGSFMPGMRIFDFADGLPEGYAAYALPSMVRGGDGRLWMSIGTGTVWLDPNHLQHNPDPPGVVITSLRIGDRAFPTTGEVTLPPGAADISFSFAVPNLRMPQRVQVRYRLEGYDKHWIDPGPRRQAFYTNLPPGDYRFRVIAANESGIWNRTGASLDLTLAPTFLQSRLFLLLASAALAGLLWLAHKWRVNRLSWQLQARLMERIAERERIARELHDTLLQGFQALVLRFHAVANRVPGDGRWRELLHRELGHADKILVEARESVGKVRAAAPDGNLADALIVAASKIDVDPAPRLDVTVEGEPRALHPIVRHEVQRVGEEAIRNAFRHSRGTEVKIRIVYDRNRFCLEIRDNGVGLPASVEAAGSRPGHFGLSGMQERARQVGGRLTITGEQGRGTTITLSIRARACYVARPTRKRPSQSDVEAMEANNV